MAPFVSMLRELDRRNDLHEVRLVYLNRNESSAAYLAELLKLAEGNPGFEITPVMTRDEDFSGYDR